MIISRIKVWHDLEEILLEDNQEASSESDFDHPLHWGIECKNEGYEGIIINPVIMTPIIHIQYTTKDKPNSVVDVDIRNFKVMHDHEEGYLIRFNKGFKPVTMHLNIKEETLIIKWR